MLIFHYHTNTRPTFSVINLYWSVKIVNTELYTDNYINTDKDVFSQYNIIITTGNAGTFIKPIHSQVSIYYIYVYRQETWI